MRIRVLLALLVVVLAVAGCGSDSDSQTKHPVQGMHSNGGFPGAGSPTAPDVTTTPGAPQKQSKGQAGGGSSATCIGC